VINANGGDDVITAGNGLSAIKLTIDGGAGNDTITAAMATTFCLAATATT